MVEIRVLGKQRVTGGPASAGHPPSARSLALLAYLVLHAGSPQARAHLAGVFWPASGESQARTNLRRELHNLRVVLGEDPSLVVESMSLLWRDTPSCRVDVRVFCTEREAAMSARSAGDRDGLLRHAEAAIAEYRGELMPGVYEEWVLDQRERLRRECVDLCDLAVGVLRECGDRVRAAEIARRRIQHEPLEEVGYRALMELQAESGDLGAAIRTYHRCATMLEQELGVSPGPQTTAMVERLLGRGEGHGRPVVTTGRSRRIGAPGSSLVGRDNEIGLLLQRWEQARHGDAGLVVVSGEAGVGKSRLIAELTAVAKAEGAVVAATRCFDLSGRLALAPVAEWLRTSHLQKAVTGLEQMWQVEVERLVPDPARILHRIPDSARGGPVTGSRAMVDAWQRHRFFEGLARAVLAADQPTLLVLDDLQWCDQETVAWLTFLLGFAGDARLLVAATLRSEELEHNQELNGWIALLTIPPAPPFPEDLWGRKSCGIVWCYTGPHDKAAEVLAPVREFGSPLLDGLHEMPFTALQSAFDALYPPGLQWYWRADFFEEISDQAIEIHRKYGEQLPTGHSTMHLYPIDGAVARVPDDATPFAYRNGGWAGAIVGVDPDPANAGLITEWTKQYWEQLHPTSAGGAYVNFMMDEGSDRVRASYLDNYDRLAQVKARYDPENLFHVNQNIPPARRPAG